MFYYPESSRIDSVRNEFCGCKTKNPKGSFELNVGFGFRINQYLFFLLPKNYDFYVMQI